MADRTIERIENGTVTDRDPVRLLEGTGETIANDLRNAERISDEANQDHAQLDGAMTQQGAADPNEALIRAFLSKRFKRMSALKAAGIGATAGAALGAMHAVHRNKLHTKAWNKGKDVAGQGRDYFGGIAGKAKDKAARYVDVARQQAKKAKFWNRGTGGGGGPPTKPAAAAGGGGGGGPNPNPAADPAADVLKKSEPTAAARRARSRGRIRSRSASSRKPSTKRTRSKAKKGKTVTRRRSGSKATRKSSKTKKTKKTNKTKKTKTKKATAGTRKRSTSRSAKRQKK